jgi:predicted membrane metal-binding protein
MVSYLQDFQVTFYMHLIAPSMLHVLPISSYVLITLLAISTNYKIHHYAIFSSLPLLPFS